MTLDSYFIDMADRVKENSKDPSTKIGVVIVTPEGIVIPAFNSFPRGIDDGMADRWERPLKYDFISHAERNAVYEAARKGVSIEGSALYMVGMGPPCTPCKECAKAVIQTGIIKVVGYSYKPAPESWLKEFEFTDGLLKEAGVEFIEYQR